MSQVYIVEKCGTVLGVPGRGPDDRWTLVRIFKTRKAAEKFITPDMGRSEWEHWRVSPWKVGP